MRKPLPERTCERLGVEAGIVLLLLLLSLLVRFLGGPLAATFRPGTACYSAPADAPVLLLGDGGNAAPMLPQTMSDTETLRLLRRNTTPVSAPAFAYEGAPAPLPLRDVPNHADWMQCLPAAVPPAPQRVSAAPTVFDRMLPDFPK